jgi:hypothetical protein
MAFQLEFEEMSARMKAAPYIKKGLVLWSRTLFLFLLVSMPGLESV